MLRRGAAPFFPCHLGRNTFIPATGPLFRTWLEPRLKLVSPSFFLYQVFAKSFFIAYKINTCSL